MGKTRETTSSGSFHERLLAQNMDSPEFRAEFDRASREISAIDALVNGLDELRESSGLSKAELARAIGKDPASVRRLLSAPANPELRTVISIADALDADIVLKRRHSGRKRRQHNPTADTERRPASPVSS